jgi:hypothetical protein
MRVSIPSALCALVGFAAFSAAVAVPVGSGYVVIAESLKSCLAHGLTLYACVIYSLDRHNPQVGSGASTESGIGTASDGSGASIESSTGTDPVTDNTALIARALLLSGRKKCALFSMSHDHLYLLTGNRSLTCIFLFSVISARRRLVVEVGISG